MPINRGIVKLAIVPTPVEYRATIKYTELKLNKATWWDFHEEFPSDVNKSD